MERADRERLIRMLKKDVRLKRLYDEHCSLEERLLQLQRRRFLTKEEEREARRIKKEKLAGVDQMMKILDSSEKESPLAA